MEVFVRWKKRASRGNPRYWQKVPDVTLSAFLVECVRIDGKPRQKVVAYIHHFHQYDLERGYIASRNERTLFWYHAQNKLRTLHLSETDYNQVIEMISKVVPPLTEEERNQQNEENERIRAAIKGFCSA